MLFLVSQRKGVWPSHGGDHEECRGWSTGRAEAGGSCGRSRAAQRRLRWAWQPNGNGADPGGPELHAGESAGAGARLRRHLSTLPPLSGPPRNLGAGSLEGTRLWWMRATHRANTYHAHMSFWGLKTGWGPGNTQLSNRYKCDPPQGICCFIMPRGCTL